MESGRLMVQGELGSLLGLTANCPWETRWASWHGAGEGDLGYLTVPLLVVPLLPTSLLLPPLEPYRCRPHLTGICEF